MAKIQAFLDQSKGNELSRLEKDLLKSYVVQLYDILVSEEAASETVPDTRHETPLIKTPRIEVPVYVPEPPRTEPSKPIFEEIKKTPVPELKVEEPEPAINVHKIEPKTVRIPMVEPVKETITSNINNPDTHTLRESLSKLFELSKVEEMADRFAHVPVANIETALGLNERIFTLNQLFGGDKALFDLTCSQLNNLTSFEEAKTLLINGPAVHFKWYDPERTKMAEQFIRIVARRYPKS